MIEQILSNPTTITYISMAITVVIGLIAKDIASNFVSGLLFYLDKNFLPGDTVYIDGHKAIIVKIGIRTTVFGLYNGRGYTWRFVLNSQIPRLELEKVITPKEVQLIPELHTKITDIENFLERVNSDFKAEMDARTTRMEEKKKDALEKLNGG